jgi:hypothetical protein
MYYNQKKQIHSPPCSYMRILAVTRTKAETLKTSSWL